MKLKFSTIHLHHEENLRRMLPLRKRGSQLVRKKKKRGSRGEPNIVGWLVGWLISMDF